jgi:hypothetical protein
VALREIGLPQKDVPLALLTFNLGFEAGQLALVAVAVSAIACLKLRLAVHCPKSIPTHYRPSHGGHSHSAGRSPPAPSVHT